MTDDEILNLLKSNAVQAPKHPKSPNLFPVADEATVSRAEESLGIELPPLLKRIYLEVGNGGCRLGPSFGILGLEGGYASSRENLIELTLGFERQTAWWDQYLVIGEDGCGSFFWVDCSESEYPVYYFTGEMISDEDMANDEPPEWGWDCEWDSFAEYVVEPNNHSMD